VDIEFEKRAPSQAAIRDLIKKNQFISEPLRVTLYSNNREVSSFLGKESVITFQNVLFGHYSLVFLRGGKKLGDYSFQIKDTDSEKNISDQ